MISIPYIIFNLIFIIIISITMSITVSQIYLKEHKRNCGICPKCGNIWVKRELYKGEIFFQCRNGHRY